MKISQNKNGWMFAGKQANLYIDPEEGIRSTDGKQIVAYTHSNSEIIKKNEDKFLINSEGRFEIGTFFIEGLYINTKKELLSYYIACDNIRFLYVGKDWETKGDDSQKNLGNIDIIMVRPEEDSDINKIPDLTSHYDPAILVVLLDKVSSEKVERISKNLGVAKSEIQDNFNIKARDIVKREDGADIMMVKG